MTPVLRNGSATIPQLPKLPVIGNLPAFRADKLGLLQRVAHECGDVGMFHVGPWPVVLINSPEYAAKVLVEHASSFEKSAIFRRYLRPILGNGLLTADNQPHRRQRQLVAPAFQPHRVQTYGETMAAYAEYVQSTWKDGQVIDVWHEMMRLTLRIAGKTLFGVDMLDQANMISETVTTFSYFANDIANTLVRVPLSWPTPKNRRVRQAITQLDAVVNALIEQRRQQPQEQDDVLSILLQAQADDGSRLTNRQLRDEVVTLLIAGHETLASALTWTWYLLAQHLEVYTRLRSEVQHALAGRTPAVADLPNLPYTRQVLQEAMRLYPPAWVLLRQAIEPVDLGKYTIPMGMRVAISPYTMHRRADLFPDPTRLVPERFSAEREQQLPRLAYLPFGAGPRSCIGRYFAELEGQLVLATLAQRVVFERIAREPIQPEPLTTLRLKQRFYARIRRQ